MIIIPAIDLKSGRCVRLLKGQFDQETVYGTDPALMAKGFAEDGAEWIHIVDLDGSVGQKPVNYDAILSIRAAVSARLELGGGIREMATIARYIELGIDRVILGTIALKNPALVAEAARLYPGQIAVGLDARGQYVAVEGWTQDSENTLVDTAKKFEDMGVCAIIYTDIDRDGALTGANIERTAELARAVSAPIIASGGVKDLDDIARLKPLEKDGVIAAITGRAIYEGTLDLKAAIAAAR